MSFDPTQIAAAIPYLTQRMTQELSEDGMSVQITGVTSPHGLALKLGLADVDAIAFEAQLRSAGLIGWTGGYYLTPRYDQTLKGAIYTVLSRSSGPLTQAQVASKTFSTVKALPADFITVCLSLGELVGQGYAATSDGGVTFTATAPA